MNRPFAKTIVASQLPEAVHLQFANQVPSIEFVNIASDTPLSLGPEITVLLPSPMGVEQSMRHQARPAGWPFHLRWVHLTSTGIDSYPPWLFEGPVVTSSRGEFGVSLAEYALAAIFAAVKKLPELWIHDVENWRFAPVGMVSGCKLGIVGFGAIGEALAERALALGMAVQVLRRSEVPLMPGVTRAADLKALLQTSDHVVLAAPLTAATEGMINREVLKSAKPGLHMINVSRGSLIDDDALLEALALGVIGLATLDCTHPEPLPAGHAFYTHPRIRLSPHTAGMTDDLIARLAAGFARNCYRFTHGEPLLHSVDHARGY